jgi:hypothetical protein
MRCCYTAQDDVFGLSLNLLDPSNFQGSLSLQQGLRADVQLTPSNSGVDRLIH